MVKDAFLVAFLGGILSLDATAVGQILVSQPLISGPLVGLVLGDVQTGLLVGALIQLLWMGKLPVGGANPSLGIAILGIFTSGLVIIYQGRGMQEGLIPPALLLGTVLGHLAQKGEGVLGHVNDHLVHWTERRVKENAFWAVEAVNWFSLVFIFLFSFSVIFCGVLLADKLLAWMFAGPNRHLVRGLVMAEKMLPVLGLAVIFNLFFNRKNRLYLLVGAGLSLAAVCLVG